MITLQYRLVSLNPYDTFDQARPWRGAIAGWDCKLAAGRLEARSSHKFANETAARADLEPWLRAWEAAAFLDGQYELTFQAVADEASAPAIAADSAGDRIYRRVNLDYPAPDATFRRTPLVERLLEGIGRFKRGEASLPTVAAAGLEELGTLAGGSNDGAALPTALATDPSVIDKFAELVGRGNQEPGRHDPPPSYRGPEWQWLQEALFRLTLQAGRAADGPPQPRLTVGDFRTQL